MTYILSNEFPTVSNWESNIYECRKNIMNDYITDIYSEESISQRFCIYENNMNKLGFDVITYVLVAQEKFKCQEVNSMRLALF